MERILGLDLGTASVGFALIDYDRTSRTGEIVHLGVRVFPETLEAKTHVPKNQERRRKRLTRRQFRRRRMRRVQLNELLSSRGFLPTYGTDEWKETMKLDPYRLRSKAIVHKLGKFEFGRAIYHLSKHRHFLGKSDDLPDFQEEPEDKATREGRDGLIAELLTKKQTLGEWLHELPPGERRRGKLASRQIVEEEFDRIVNHQRSYHQDDIEGFDKVCAEFKSIIFMQRPVFWRLKTLGECQFAPGKDLCPSGSWLAHQRRMIEMVNNLSRVGNYEPLSQVERNALIEALSHTTKKEPNLNWKRIREILKATNEELDEDSNAVKFNLEVGGEKKLLGNPVERQLRRVFGNEFDSHPNRDEIRDGIFWDCFECDYHIVGDQRVEICREPERIKKRQELVTKLIMKYDISESEARQLANMKFKVGWEPYSIEAMRIFVEQLSKGHRMGDLLNGPSFEQWRSDVFPNRLAKDVTSVDLLPTPRVASEQRRLGQIRNPTVVRTFNEMRKVVNNLVRTYGKPDVIRVEFGRDLGKTGFQRGQIQSRMKKREAAREKARKDLQEKLGRDPNRDEIERWQLWHECRHKCPFTGQAISFNELLGAAPSFEVEHIWPRSRCNDDSMLNKTLCLSSENRIKDSRIPFEYLDETQWYHFKKRVESMRKGKGEIEGMSNAKIDRILATRIPDDFSTRQLNDTRYVARVTRDSLQRLVKQDGEVRVQAVSGQATAKIRHLWGLGGILNEGSENKTRDDHRHHAIDAFVVACIDPGITQRLSRYYKQIETNIRSAVLEPPWQGARTELEKSIRNVVVSHKVIRKTTGSLHKETIYGRELLSKLNLPESDYIDPQMEYVTVSRQTLKSVVGKANRIIIDKTIREKAKNLTDKDIIEGLPIGKKDRRVHKVKFKEKYTDESMIRVQTGYARKDENHHVAIYRNASGSIEYVVVPLVEVARRVQAGQPIVQKTYQSSLQFLYSLGKGDSVQITKGERLGYWVVNSVTAKGQVHLSMNQDAGSSASKSKFHPKVTSLPDKYGCRKVSVDPIGRIRFAGD